MCVCVCVYMCVWGWGGGGDGGKGGWVVKNRALSFPWLFFHTSQEQPRHRIGWDAAAGS